MSKRSDIEILKQDIAKAIKDPAFEETRIQVFFANSYFTFNSIEGNKAEFKIKEIVDKKTWRNRSIKNFKDDVFTVNDIIEFMSSEPNATFDVWVGDKYGSGGFFSTSFMYHGEE